MKMISSDFFCHGLFESIVFEQEACLNGVIRSDINTLIKNEIIFSFENDGHMMRRSHIYELSYTSRIKCNFFLN